MAILKDLIVQGNSNLIGDVQGKKFIVTNGTSSQFLKGDGSLDSTAYVSTSRTISTASGLTGGGNLSANRTIGLAATGTAGTYKQVVVDAYGRVTSGNTADNNSWRSIKVNGTNFLTDTSTALNLSSGTNVTLTTGSTGLLTISAKDTTYSVMSAAEVSAGTATSSRVIRADYLKTGLNALYQPKGSYAAASHNQASNTITAMTSYSIASASGAVSTSDSLNAAIGKLEKRIALLEAALGGMKLVKLTTDQYNALTTKDSNTLYIISD